MSDLIQLYANANIRIGELERENAALKAVSDEPTSGLLAYIEYLRRRNMEVKIERNRYKVALQDIASSSTGWARERAQMELRKEEELQ